LTLREGGLHILLRRKYMMPFSNGVKAPGLDGFQLSLIKNIGT
jgi:hypothetical protein